MDRKMKARLANAKAKARKDRSSPRQSDEVHLEVGQLVNVEGTLYEIARNESYTSKDKLN